MTQYHQVLTSTTKYWPVPPNNDPVPPSTDQYHPIMIHYHQVLTSNTQYWPSIGIPTPLSQKNGPVLLFLYFSNMLNKIFPKLLIVFLTNWLPYFLNFSAWFTRPERPKGAKDEVKRPVGPPARCRGPRVADIELPQYRRYTKGQGLLWNEGPLTYVILSQNLVLSRFIRFFKGHHRAFYESKPDLGVFLPKVSLLLKGFQQKSACFRRAFESFHREVNM